LRSFNTYLDGSVSRMRALRICATALLAAGSTHIALAIDPNRTMSQYVRQQWGLENGFPRGPVYAIDQTADGYLWIGTEAGLVRFDGLSFNLIQSQGDALPAINHVLGIATDEKGDLWARLRRPNLLHYLNGAFEDPRRSAPLSQIAVTAMSRCRDGSLLFWGANANPVLLRDGKFQVLPAPAAFSQSAVLSVVQTENGDIWVGTRDAGLFRIRGGTATPITQGLPDLKVNSLVAAKNNQIWVATDGGIARWDGNKLTKEGVPNILDGVQALSMALDRDANLWIGTNSLGLARLNERGLAFLEDPHQPGRDAVTAIFEDREGNLWVGSANQLERLRDSAFVTYSLPEGLPTDGSNSVYVDSENRMWFPPVNGGLWWMKDGQHGTIALDGLNKDVVYSIAGEKGELWLGRQQGGLTQLRYDKDAFRAKTYTHANGLAQDSVFTVYQDRESAVWAGTLSGGVSKLDHGKFTTYTIADGLASNSVQAIFESSDGTMWVATPSGLSALRLGQWRTYTAADGMVSSDVISLMGDGAGMLWIGTKAGLAYHDSRGFHVPRKVPDSLHEEILGMIEDRFGWFWISTTNHVLRVNRDKLLRETLGPGDMREYGLADGLRGVEGVNRQRSVVADSLGRIWFSLNLGISVVDPVRLISNTAPAIPHVEAISADGGRLDLRGAIRIPGGRRRITLNYAGLSLSVPERVRFRYRLDGFDQAWSPPAGVREAVYTNLAPRPYRFRLMVSNPDGAWSDREATVTFEVLPLFWQTVWFRICVVAACIFAALGVYQFRLRQITARLNLRFEERLAERNRIAQELHDTLLQGFLSASMQVHVAADRLTADSPAKPTLNRAIRLMGQVIEEGRNAVRGLRSSQSVSLDLEEAFSRIREGRPPEDSASQSIDFRIVVDGVRRPLHPALRDDLYRIGREALINAFRHSGARRIEMALKYEPGQLRMIVRDDGRGIEPQVIRSGRDGHWGLPGMRERAERIGAQLHVYSGAAAGTRIELSVPGRVVYQDQPKRHPNWFRRLRKTVQNSQAD
jgi:ligand-binding sensor domain-containing protein/signal transduction histidine kinase